MVTEFDEPDFFTDMSGLIHAPLTTHEEELIHLTTERHNPIISWAEFAGDFT